MFQLLRSLGENDLLFRQAPVLLLALALADSFYKFHSFLLETGAFLLTWFALDAAWQGVAMVRRRMAGGYRRS